MIHRSDEHRNRLGIRVDGFTGAVRVLDEDALDDERLSDVRPEPEDPFGAADEDEPDEDEADEDEPDEDEDLLGGEDDALD